VSMFVDLIGIAEIAYRTDLGAQAWLDGLVSAVKPMLDFGHGIGGAVIDVEPLDHEMAPRVEAFSAADLSQHSIAAFEGITAIHAHADVRVRFARAGSVSSMRRTLGPMFGVPGSFGQIMRRNHVADCSYVLAGDLAGRMCVLASPNESGRTLNRQARSRLAYIAAHVHAGMRLRAPVPVSEEAIANPDGRLCDAQGAALEPRNQTSLRLAIQAFERARGPLRRTDPDAALTLWRALVEGRWTLVDRFDSDGRRFVIARVNPWPSAAQAHLTAGEVHVAELVLRGFSNKLIAYELGLSTATVGTHLSRALAKLGVRSRVELLALFPQGLPRAESDARVGGQ
jgi:DNA-binding CsgD family transcriptional regulator